MKKIVSLFIFLLLLVGCSLSNSPTSKVEELLNKYQTLDSDIKSGIDDVLKEENLNDSQKERYRKVIEKQYRNLAYEIKDERIDGDRAVVTVEIEVDDYSKVLKESSDKLTSDPEYFNDENGKYSHTKYIDYQLDLMKKNKDKVKYTLELTLTKKDKKWVMDNLTTTDMEKMNGTYNY